MYEAPKAELADETPGKTTKGKRTKGNGAHKPKREKPEGRKDESKQPAVTQPKVILERIEELVQLHGSAVEAAVEAKEAITKAAEDSGYNAANVRKLVLARYSEKFPEVKRNIEQQSELFEEVGG